MNDTLTNNEYKLISSLWNKKFRDINKLYIIEGAHLIEEYLNSQYSKNSIEFIIKRDDFENDVLIDKLSFIEVQSLNRIKFDKLCDTKTPQGILAVVEKKMINKNGDEKFVVALDRINDPGNLGTILRTCYWFGVDKVLISENSADLYNPKTIRSTQGSLFHLDIETDVNLKTKLDSLYKNGFGIYLTTLNGNALDGISDKCVLVFGNEANGVSKELIANDDYKQIKIEAHTDCESLNVSVSSGIFINEFRKALK